MVYAANHAALQARFLVSFPSLVPGREGREAAYFTVSSDWAGAWRAAAEPVCAAACGAAIEGRLEGGTPDEAEAMSNTGRACHCILPSRVKKRRSHFYRF